MNVNTLNPSLATRRITTCSTELYPKLYYTQKVKSQTNKSKGI